MYFNELFIPTQVVIATWNNVGYYQAQTDKVLYVHNYVYVAPYCPYIPLVYTIWVELCTYSVHS